MEQGQAGAVRDRTFAMSGVNDVIEGVGAAQRLKRHLPSFEGRRVTVLTSPSVFKAGWFDAVVGDLPGRSVSVVGDVRPHNDSDSLDRILDLLAEQPPDVIIAIVVGATRRRRGRGPSITRRCCSPNRYGSMSLSIGRRVTPAT